MMVTGTLSAMASFVFFLTFCLQYCAACSFAFCSDLLLCLMRAGSSSETLLTLDGRVERGETERPKDPLTFEVSVCWALLPKEALTGSRRTRMAAPMLPPRLPARGFSEVSDDSGHKTVHVTLRYRGDKYAVVKETTVRLPRSAPLDTVRARAGGRLVLGTRELTQGTVGAAVYNFAMVDVYPAECDVLVTVDSSKLESPPWSEVFSLSAYISRPLPDAVDLLPAVVKPDTNQVVRPYAKVQDLIDPRKRRDDD
ncbi:MAG: hypothetical protein AAF213_01385, partial [Pseudomonadota bacterium]